jgi:hypothetical protein
MRLGAIAAMSILAACGNQATGASTMDASGQADTGAHTDGSGSSSGGGASSSGGGECTAFIPCGPLSCMAYAYCLVTYDGGPAAYSCVQVCPCSNPGDAC